jgi:hypothetical protein
MFSPQWDCSDTRLVFDRNSGDYWVVSLLAAMVLEQFDQQPVLRCTQIKSHLGDLRVYADLDAALKLTLQSLIDNELLANADHTKAGVVGLN